MNYEKLENSPWNSIDTVAEMWNNRYYLLEFNSNYFYLIEMFEDKSYNKVYLNHNEGCFLIKELNLLHIIEDFNDVWITAKQIIGRIEQKQEIIKQKTIAISELRKDIQTYNSILKQNETNISRH